MLDKKFESLINNVKISDNKSGGSLIKITNINPSGARQ